MVRISHTNVIVDEFSTARNNPFNKYIHFLTHIHADHLKGLSNSWDYGPIYCSSITKSLIMLKFPRLKCLKQLQLQKPYTIALSSQLQITVTMFDANHCAGGVMLLLQGYMGTVLYTGDMRFDKQVFSEYTYLYPHVRRNKQFKHCSIDIDFLYLDTTFLHPKFSFPPKPQALKQLDKYIQQTISKAKEENKFIEFYIGIDSFGKQEVLVHLAQKFQTLITVSEQRYKNISLIGLESQYFTTDPQAGFIHIVLKRQLKQYVADKQNCIGIILTGWANNAHCRSAKVYAIPYSLHSSYPELVQFVDSIRPCYIESILEVALSSSAGQRQSSKLGDRQSNKLDRQSNGQYSYSMNNNSNKQSKAGELKLASKKNSNSVSYNYNNNTSYGNNNNNQTQLYEQINTSQYLNKLRNQYTTKPSSQLIFLMSNIQFQKKIKQKLKLDRNSVQINRQQQISNTTTNIIRVQNINRTGVKLNNQRDQEQIQRIKQRLKNKKQSAKNNVLNQYTNKISIKRKKQQQQQQHQRYSRQYDNNQNDNKQDDKQKHYREQDDKQEQFSINIRNRRGLPLELQDYYQKQINNQQKNKSFNQSNQIQIQSKSRSITSSKKNHSNKSSSSCNNSNSKQSINQNNDYNQNINQNINENFINNKSYQKNQVNKLFNDSKQSIQDNNQTNRRNKWKQKVQQGQIDLFGQISIPTKPNQINNNNNIKINNNNNNLNKQDSKWMYYKGQSLKNSNNSNSLSKSTFTNNKKYIQHNNIIQLLSDEDDQNHNLNIQTNKISQQHIQNTNSSSRSKRTNRISTQKKINIQKQKKNNISTQKKNISINISNQEIILPKQRQPDQRSIIEFFNKKSTKKSQQSKTHLIQQQNKNKQNQQNHLTLPQKQINQQSYQSDLNDNQQQQHSQMIKAIEDQRRLQMKGFRILKDCKQVSILAINSIKVDQFKQAKPNKYKKFFLTNKI